MKCLLVLNFLESFSQVTGVLLGPSRASKYRGTSVHLQQQTQTFFVCVCSLCHVQNNETEGILRGISLTFVRFESFVSESNILEV